MDEQIFTERESGKTCIGTSNVVRKFFDDVITKQLQNKTVGTACNV